MKKKLLLTLGSISSVTLPIAAVVSCGVEDATNEQKEINNNLATNESFQRIELLWQQTLIKKIITAFDFEDPLKTTEIANAFDFFLRNKLRKDPSFFQNIREKIVKLEDFPGATLNDKLDTLKKAGLYSYIQNGDITNVIEVDASGTNPVVRFNPKKYILKNNNDLKIEFYKFFISSLYLKKATKDEYKEIMMDENQELTETQKLIDTTDFVLTNEALNQKIFAKWELTQENNLNLLNTYENSKKSVTDMKTEMKMGTSSTIFTDVKYSDEHSQVLEHEYTKAVDYKDFKGYKQFQKVTGTKGLLKFELSELKKATTNDAWNGFIDDGELKTKATDEIHYVLKDAWSTTKATFVSGVMPIFDGGKFKMDGSYFGNGEEVAQILAINKIGLYSDAVKYFTSDKNKTSKFIVEILNSKFRDELIAHGFKFIKEN